MRTRSNSLDVGDEKEEEARESNKAKTNKASEAKWQAIHPLEVLRGRESSKDAVAANHSHFQWGETVTRSPAHPVRHK